MSRDKWGKWDKWDIRVIQDKWDFLPETRISLI